MSPLQDTHPVSLERLGPADLAETLIFLEHDPVLNVYLIALALRDALARPGDETWGARRDGRLAALLYLGGRSGAVLPVGDDLEAVRLLGEHASARSAVLPRRYQVIGARDSARALLERFPGAGAPRLERDQIYMALEPDALCAFEPLPELRPARREDYAPLYESGALLRAEELLEDPRVADPVAYARRVEEDCRDGHTFVWRDARGLCFRASVSAITEDAAQLSGVYTPPAFRRQGVATRALAELSSRLQRRSRRLCLFVNTFNVGAIELYGRLGFTTRAPWWSAFFDAG